MPNGKLYATSINESEVVALGIVYDRVVAWAPKEDRGTSGFIGTFDHELWLKEPRAVAVCVWFKLAIHKEQRDKPLALCVGANGSLDANFLLIRVGC
jgi:hypothetical protein